jgi:hypothetical protein
VAYADAEAIGSLHLTLSAKAVETMVLSTTINATVLQIMYGATFILLV